MRVLHLADGGAAGRAAAVEPIRELLAAQLRELEAHDPGVRAGDDPEDVHRCRVATRRARAIVRATEPLLGTALSELAEELKWVASLLGPVRDLDVLLERLRAEVVSLGDERAAAETLVAAFESERNDSRRQLLRGTALGAVHSAVRELRRANRGSRRAPRPRQAEAACCESAPQARAAGFGARRRPARREPPRTAHPGQARPLRRRARRVEKVERYLDAVKRLQDVVGEHQDAVVAIERLQQVADAVNAVAVGRLVEREHARKRRCRGALPAALRATLRQGRKALG